MALTPSGGFQVGKFVAGFFTIPVATRFSASLASVPGMFTAEGIDRLIPVGVSAGLSTLLYVTNVARTNFVLGWGFSQVGDAVGMLSDRVVLAITESRRMREAQALPQAKSPEAKGITGRRFEQEAGGIMGRKFDQDAGGVTGRLFDQQAGQAESESEVLRRLKEKIDMGEADPAQHVHIS